jgi:hypothetical protein
MFFRAVRIADAKPIFISEAKGTCLLKGVEDANEICVHSRGTAINPGFLKESPQPDSFLCASFSSAATLIWPP